MDISIEKRSDIRRGIWTGVAAAAAFVAMVSIFWICWRGVMAVRVAIAEAALRRTEEANAVAQEGVRPEFMARAHAVAVLLRAEHQLPPKNWQSFRSAQDQANKAAFDLASEATTVHELHIASALVNHEGKFTGCIYWAIYPDLDGRMRRLSECEPESPVSQIDEALKK